MKLKDYLYNGLSDFYESTANNILKNVSFDHPREIDLYELCNFYGMKVVTSSDDVNFSVASNVDRRGVILLSRTNNKLERQHLAEEFAHLFIHHKNQLTEAELSIKKLEVQAEKLASNILLPTEWLMNIEVFPFRNEMRILASDIAEDFDVTPEYAFRRLKQLNSNYLFGMEPTGMFKNVLYDAPIGYFVPKPRIYVVLDKETRFSLD